MNIGVRILQYRCGFFYFSLVGDSYNGCFWCILYGNEITKSHINSCKQKKKTKERRQHTGKRDFKGFNILLRSFIYSIDELLIVKIDDLSKVYIIIRRGLILRGFRDCFSGANGREKKKLSELNFSSYTG